MYELIVCTCSCALFFANKNLFDQRITEVHVMYKNVNFLDVHTEMSRTVMTDIHVHVNVVHFLGFSIKFKQKARKILHSMAFCTSLYQNMYNVCKWLHGNPSILF